MVSGGGKGRAVDDPTLLPLEAVGYDEALALLEKAWAVSEERLRERIVEESWGGGAEEGATEGVALEERSSS